MSSFTELAATLQHEVDRGVALETLEDEVGWELRRHLDRPETFAELPAIALADIGAPFGVDWRSFLPAAR